jgi:hypothetical protein
MHPRSQIYTPVSAMRPALPRLIRDSETLPSGRAILIVSNPHRRCDVSTSLGGILHIPSTRPTASSALWTSNSGSNGCLHEICWPSSSCYGSPASSSSWSWSEDFIGRPTCKTPSFRRSSHSHLYSVQLVRNLRRSGPRLAPRTVVSCLVCRAPGSSFLLPASPPAAPARQPRRSAVPPLAFHLQISMRPPP